MPVRSVLDEAAIDNGRDPADDEISPPEGFHPPGGEEDGEQDAPAERAGPGGTAADRGWGAGHPTDRRRDMARVTVGAASVWVHREIAPLVAWLMAETERRGYALRGGQCWGYANRAIRGSTRPSNHSWGLAVDLNAPANPMAAELVTDMPEWMPELWEEHGFEWGGNYRRRKDAMHYEFTGTPAEARDLATAVGHDEPVPARLGDEEEVAFMYNPPIVVEPVVASVAWPGGGSLLLSASGAVYTFDGARFQGSAAGKPYFEGRRAARIELNKRGGYDIVATTKERYSYPE